jgi:hypothetical protein
MRLVVQNDIQQWTRDFDAAVVVNKPQFSKFVHEKTHPGPGRSDRLESGRRFRVKAAQQAEVLTVKEDVDKVYCTVLDYGL